jgi:hypothetical protein
MSHARFSPLHPGYLTEGAEIGISQTALRTAHLPITHTELPEPREEISQPEVLHTPSRFPYLLFSLLVIAVIMVSTLWFGWMRLSTLEHTARSLPLESAREKEALDLKIRSLAQVVSVLVREVKRTPQTPSLSATASVGTTSKLTGSSTVGVITSDRAALFSNPGSDGTPLMHLPRGTRVLVEKVQGRWLQVVSPRGTSAYLDADSVSLKR